MIPERKKEMLNLQWKEVQSKEQPIEIDAIATGKGVYLRKDIIFDEEVYKYKEVLLPNEYKYEILDTEEYMTKLLETFKAEAFAENERLLANKKTIETSFGEFSIKTPTYDFVFCLMFLKDLPTGIPEGKIRLADGTPVRAMTQEEVVNLYIEFTTAIAGIDSLFTENKIKIATAKNISELEAIEIAY